MNIITSGSVSIRQARRQFNADLKEWDESVERRDTTAARRVRRKIQFKARMLLPQPVSSAAGWYIFVDLDRSLIDGGVLYIGIAETSSRSMGRRIADRFKDDSCLDEALDDLSEVDQRAIILRRLLTVLPESGKNYVDKHLSAAELVRKTSHIFMIATDASVSDIREVERILIGSAVLAGAQLTNVQARTLKGPYCEENRKLSQAVLREAGCLGMDEDAVRKWRSAIPD